ncbi:hypothetical protein [Marinoscillum luteum]|uniref:Site-specific DNA-methyltransferase (cytosine-N(4)-specific) n=1 Tax=Marinoscillum luteum TaxID=861051 RepID=A0ABW7N7N5_9BACT
MIIDLDIKDTLGAISSEVLNGQNYNRSDFARSILNYPAMMVPSVQEPIIKSLSENLHGEVSLIDPFMGASNTLVTGMKYGLNVFGQDINPLSLLVSQVKTTYYSLCELEEARKDLIARIDSDMSILNEINFPNINKWFSENIQIELSKIYRAIQCQSDSRLRRFFWVAMAEVVRLTSNDRTSTFKLHIRTLEDIQSRNNSAVELFKSIVKRSIKDVAEYCQVLNESGYIKNGRYVKEARVVWGDSLAGLNTTRKFNLLVTSPPYGDNQTTVTYGQFSYLPLQWIPMEDIDTNIEIDYLKTTMEIDSNSLGGKMVKNFSNTQEALFTQSPSLQLLFASFDPEEKKRAKKVINFFHDLNKSIDTMLSKMTSRAYMVWTVGNRNVNKRLVRNDLIITDLLQSKGVELVTDLERDILSKRMPGRNNFSDLMSKEKILIFKTP